tara:strand:+ start:1429 stop:2751 length:1323 start_codon:yes stop_codon:yes gene_type:complete
MGATLELKYFNSYWLKKMSNVVDANPQPTAPYATVPQAYANDNTNDWFIEEARIRGGYNNTITDLGVKAHIVEDNPNNQNRFNTIIYSGVFNSRTGINQTNEFSVGEDITRSVDPAHGSIQKLFAEDTNLIIFQEDKVNRALIDKDAIYTAEGQALTASGRMVIGQIVPFAGKYGIATDPFSFAVYGYRKYFTDRKRGCVLRLTTGGEIIEISGYGMHDFFRDQLTQDGITRIVGGWDNHTKNYILSIQTASSYKTTSFDEGVQGWTSFFSFKPSFMFSLTSTFFSTNAGKLYSHYGTSNYGEFYTVKNDSDVTVVLNSSPSTVKVFKTVNYEGGTDWTVDSIVASSGDIALAPISKYSLPSNLTDLESEMFSNKFKRKENKYFANIINNSSPGKGEILWGASMTGVKGFFSTFKFSLDNSINQKRELFAVSSDTVESSY